MCITYSFLSCKFSIAIFSGKNLKSWWRFFRILNINYKKISFITIFISMKSLLNWDILSNLRQQLWHCPSIEIIYILILKNSWFSIFIIIFMYLLLKFPYWWRIPPLILFPTIINVSVSVYWSSNTWVFLKDPCEANLWAEYIWAG